MTDRNRLVAETLSAHALTFLSAFPPFAFRNSETILVSSKYIKTGPLGGKGHHPTGAG